MCRLLGYCTQGSASVAEMLGDRALGDFTSLSSYHCHGWGMAWYGDTGPSRPARVQKSALQAADDPVYHALARRRLGSLGLVHLRRATPGLPVRTANSHPFWHLGFTMAHNGALHPQDRLGELLAPEWAARLTGNTDSEHYFLSVISRLEAAGGDVVTALAQTAAHIDRQFSASSLNAILLSPDALYAICWYDPQLVPSGAVSQDGYSGPPERYFDLAYREARGCVVVASTGWPQESWAVLPNHHILAVDRATLRTTVHAFTAAGVLARPESPAWTGR